MPAEWEAHQATWLAWPHNRTDWPGKFDAIPWVYAEIVRHLAVAEKVEIIVNSAAEEKRACTILSRSNVSLANIEFHHWATNRGWTRDSGPIFIVREDGSRRSRAAGFSQKHSTGDPISPLAVTDWRFNGWAKYPDWQSDDKLAGRVARKLNILAWLPAVTLPSGQRRVVLEGGSIDVNGQGTLLTTEECLLGETQARNPGLSRAQLENIVAEYLGIKKVLWLGRGIVGDDTHGHVDDIARFVSPNTVVVASERNRRDENFAALQENLTRLNAATDQDGRPLRMAELPMPAPIVFRGRRLPASYANFYIANGVVLIPTFNDANDRAALNLFAELLPGRKVVGIYCGDLIWGFGAIHCMTQQQPRV